MPPKKRDRDGASDDDNGFPALVLQWKDDDGDWNDFSGKDQAILVKAANAYLKDQANGGKAKVSDKFTTKEMSFSTDNAVTFCWTDSTQLNEDTKKKRIFRCLQSKGVWEFKDDDGFYVAFYEDDSNLIERAWRSMDSGSGKYKTKALSWNKGYDSQYQFVFTEDPKAPASPKAIQRNEDTGTQRILRRVEPKGTGAWEAKSYGIAKMAAPTVKDALAAGGGDEDDGNDAGGALDMSVFDPPDYWEPQTKPLEFFVLPEGGKEYNRVLAPFKKTIQMKKLKIHSVKRIQNETLWKFYALTRYKVACRNGGNPNEMTDLFHGARVKDNMDAIMNFGFDLRVARDGLAGVGIYFAVNSSYSNAGYVLQHPDNSKEMFVCRVACGTGAEGRSGMKKPPPKKGGKKTLGEDNLCDSVHRPGGTGPKIMHVVFDNTQAIPEYLIHYTASYS